jgi:hypothetical protein
MPFRLLQDALQLPHTVFNLKDVRDGLHSQSNRISINYLFNGGRNGIDWFPQIFFNLQEPVFESRVYTLDFSNQPHSAIVWIGGLWLYQIPKVQ